MSGFIFVHQRIGNKNAIVVAQTKNERRDDDVDDVEFNVKRPHDAQDGKPAQYHWNVSDERQFKSSVGNNQHD